MAAGGLTRTRVACRGGRDGWRRRRHRPAVTSTAGGDTGRRADLESPRRRPRARRRRGRPRRVTAHVWPRKPRTLVRQTSTVGKRSRRRVRRSRARRPRQRPHDDSPNGQRARQPDAAAAGEQPAALLREREAAADANVSVTPGRRGSQEQSRFITPAGHERRQMAGDEAHGPEALIAAVATARSR